MDSERYTPVRNGANQQLPGNGRPNGNHPLVFSSPVNPSMPETDSRAYVYGGQEPIEDGAHGLIDYWRILSWRKGTILAVAFCAGIVGILITSTEQKTYQAHVSLEVQDIDQDFPNLKSQSNQTYYALNDIQTQVRLLQSTRLLERTISKLSTQKPEVQRITNYSSVPWRRVFGLPEPVMTISRHKLLADAADSLRVHAAGQTRVIDVSVDSVDPHLAADFANVLAEEFIDDNIESRWKMSQRTSDWLGVEMEKTRAKLEQSEASLQAYARQAGLLFTNNEGKESTNVSEDKLKQLQQSLSSATADRMAKQSRYEVASSSSPDGLADVVNDPTLHEYSGKLTDLQRQIAELISVYTADYPKVKRLRAQAGTLEAAFLAERKSILDRIKNDYTESVKREDLLKADYTNQVRTVTGESEKAIRYTTLKRDVESNRQLFDAMLQRVKQSGITSALRASNIRVVDKAAAPESAYKPALKINLGLSVFTGLFLGFAIALIRERTNRSLQSPGQTPLCLNVPELGVIPSESRSTIKALYEPGDATRKGRVLQAIFDSAGSSAVTESPALVTLNRKSSMMAEAFRVVIPHVMFSRKTLYDTRAIVISSASPCEGKTTVACNLSIALAEIGVKVLLIDGDLRRPRLHTVFGLDNTVGMSSILQSAEPEESMLSRSIQTAASENLHILVSGPAIHDPGKTLFAEHLPELLATLKQRFEIILIDAPPILQLPDARVLGRMADGVILVVRAGKTTREAALAAFRSVAEVQCRVLGTILNHWDSKKFPLGYDSTYYSRYAR
jgi:polysaccharide biosynthesis transport protein